MAHLVASAVASHSDGGKTARALAGMINPKLLWNPPERDLAMALKKALASMPVPVPTVPMVPVSLAPFAAVRVSAGPATPNRPRAAKTAVPSAAGDLPDCSLCGGSVKVTKVVKETKNKGRDFYACDCTDPYFIVFVDEYNASPAAANAAKLHTLKRATRMPPTSRTWTSFQPKRMPVQWTQTRYHPTFTEEACRHACGD
jgi:hypothetical protein